MSKVFKMCLLEKFFIDFGFELIHDGLKDGQPNPGRPTDISCFTRKYRLKVDGEWRNRWVKFVYDRRESLADFEVYSRDPEMSGREKMQLNLAQEEAGYQQV